MVKEIKGATNNTVAFSKQLASFVVTLVALAPVTSGLYTIWYARNDTKHFTTYMVAFTGCMTAIFGLLITYKVLMRNNKEK